LFPIGYKIVHTNRYNVIIFYPNCIILIEYEHIVPSVAKLIRLVPLTVSRVQVSVDVNVDVRDVMPWMLLGMLQLGFVASNNAETDFIELISNEPDRSGTSQNGRKQDIQQGNLAENKTFGTDFPRLEQK
jgi:hypothetical protein